MKLEWLTPAGISVNARIPAHVDSFVEIIGIDATLELILTYGGTTITASAEPRRSRLVATIGRDAVKALYRAHGPAKISVPLASSFVARVLRSRGEAVSSIARRLRRTEATVRLYLRPSAMNRRRRSADAEAQ